MFTLLAILSIDKHSLAPNLILCVIVYYTIYIQHILTMLDKPFSVLLHIATSLESSLFIVIFNTIYGGPFFSTRLSTPFLILFFTFIWKPKVSFIFIRICFVCLYVNVHIYTCTYISTCIISCNFNFIFPNQGKEKASSKCSLFLSHFLLSGFTFFTVSLPLSFSSISPFFPLR